MTDRTQPSSGPWERFAAAFAERRGAVWAWRALLLCVGLAVLAPLLANERPYFARVRDVQGYAEAHALLSPIAQAVVREARGDPGRGSAGFGAEARALQSRLDTLELALAPDSAPEAGAALAGLEAALLSLESAVAAGDGPARASAADLFEARLAPAVLALALPGESGAGLRPITRWPLFAALSFLDVAAVCAWGLLVTFRASARILGLQGVGARLLALLVASLFVASLAQLAPRGGPDTSAWKRLAAADPESTVVFAPIPFGPAETDLARPLEAPGGGPATAGPVAGARAHLFGTDALGRDLLARLLYAGRTSFAVACLAALVVSLVGGALGIAAGTLRGAVDFLVLRAIELLQAFPTLVLLLGLVALLPGAFADSPWTVPLAIGAVGWTHVARLARAEALRVSQAGFVQAAIASGFPRARVLGRHVLPNALGPIWIAASFVLSAGLVLESSLSFLGFGVRPPAPSFGGLLADARATQAWWLAVLPGLWLFAAILSIHLVGEGVRDALDPRREREVS